VASEAAAGHGGVVPGSARDAAADNTGFAGAAGGHVAAEAVATADTTDCGTEGALGAEALAMGEFGDANTDAEAIGEADADDNADEPAG